MNPNVDNCRNQRGELRYKYKRKDGKNRLLHILILEQCLGRNLAPNECGHHINGDTFDNRPDNLRAMPTKEHSKLHATGRKDTEATTRKRSMSHMGLSIPDDVKAKLSVANSEVSANDVQAIRRMLASGIQNVKIAQNYNISAQSVSRIKHRRTWAWLP